MAIYRRQPYDYGAKFGNTAQNVLSAILGVKGFKGSQAASAAGAELDRAQAAKVAEEAAMARETFLGKGTIPAQMENIYNAPNIPGMNLFTAAEQGFYPYSNEARAGQISALLGPTGGGKEYSALFPQVQQDVGATRAWATPTGQNVAGVASITEALRKASGASGFFDPRKGMYSLYSPGGQQETMETVDLGGGVMGQKPVKRVVPPTLTPGLDFSINSEGRKVGQVSEDEAMEAQAIIEEQKLADVERVALARYLSELQGPPIPPMEVPSATSLRNAAPINQAPLIREFWNNLLNSTNNIYKYTR